MAEDLEVGVLLKPKNNLEDEVQDQEMAIGGGGGGDLTPGQQEQQEGTIAGGVSRGLAGAAIIGGILSQLKSITGLLDAVFGFLSRALLPTVEVISDLIRPLISGINDFIRAPQQTVQSIQQTTLNDAVRQVTGTTEGDRIDVGDVQRETEGTVFEGIADFVLPGPATADQTGEASKQQFKQNLDEAQRDKTGSFR